MPPARKLLVLISPTPNDKHFGTAGLGIPDLMRDFEATRMERVCRAPLLPMENWPKPRYDLVEEKFGLASVNTTRGCPCRCEFCSVPLLSPECRTRPVEAVLEDIALTQSPIVYFADESFVLSGKNRGAEGRAEPARSRLAFPSPPQLGP